VIVDAAECLKSEAEFVTSEPGLLNRGGLFTDAMALCAIWPVEMDDYRLLVCQVSVINSSRGYIHNANTNNSCIRMTHYCTTLFLSRSTARMTNPDSGLAKT
jgi:hypothetical protein